MNCKQESRKVIVVWKNDRKQVSLIVCFAMHCFTYVLLWHFIILWPLLNNKQNYRHIQICVNVYEYVQAADLKKFVNNVNCGPAVRLLWSKTSTLCRSSSCDCLRFTAIYVFFDEVNESRRTKYIFVILSWIRNKGDVGIVKSCVPLSSCVHWPLKEVILLHFFLICFFFG